jgi:hypothetical protein
MRSYLLAIGILISATSFAQGKPPTAEEAKKTVGQILADSSKKGFSCDKALYPLDNALLNSGAKPSLETKPAFDLLLKCAKELKHWRFYTIIALEIYNTDKSIAKADAIVYGFTKQGKFAEAEKALKDLKKQSIDDIELLEIGTYLLCEQEKFTECLKSANEVAKKNEKTKDKDIKAKIDGYLASLKMKSYFYLGKFTEFEKAATLVEKKEPAYAERYRKEAILAKDSKIIINVIAEDVIPLGTYHLFSENKKSPVGPVVSVSFYNLDTKKDRKLKVEASIEGITQVSSSTIALIKSKKDTVSLAPPLKLELDVAKVRSNRSAQIKVKVYDAADKDKIVFEQSYPVTVLPRNQLPKSKKVNEEISVTVDGFLGAFVTPNAKKVQAFLTEAKKNIKGEAFEGTYADSMPQVKAIYDTLKAKNVSYVLNDGMSLEGGDSYQFVRVPSEVLELSNAQCMESTLLFASILESIRLQPVFVTHPGHIYLAWRPTDSERKAKKLPANALFYVETTALHDHTFEEAVKMATERQASDEKQGLFKSGKAKRIDLEVLRELGFSPQPYDD